MQIQVPTVVALTPKTHSKNVVQCCRKTAHQIIIQNSGQILHDAPIRNIKYFGFQLFHSANTRRPNRYCNLC